MLETELGEPVERAFGSFEFEPLAAASIGQTHRAVLADGTPVVVKVQRPGIDEVVARDAAVLRLATSQLERRVEAARAIRLGGFSEELIAGLEEELDYLHEGAVGTRLRENRADDAGIAVPRVHASLSTGRVLVMEQVVARPIDDPGAIAHRRSRATSSPGGCSRRSSARCSTTGCSTPTRTPATCCSTTQGTIWLLDFGSVGRLDARALDGLRGIALGVATNEPGDPGARRADARRRRRLRRPARARDRHERAARRARRARRARPARDRRGARGHAAPRHAPAVVDHAAGPRADHARGHAARDRPGPQPRQDEPRGRHDRPPRRVRHAGGAAPARGAVGAPGAADAARARRDAREPAALRAAHGAHRALRRRRPRRGRLLGRPPRDRADRRHERDRVGGRAARGRDDRQRRHPDGAVDPRLRRAHLLHHARDARGGARAPAPSGARRADRRGDRVRRRALDRPVRRERRRRARRSPASSSSRSRSTSSGSSRSPGCRSAGWPPWCCCSAS